MTDWKKKAEDLWQLLDNIDTADDFAKSDDAAYRRTARKYASERFEHMISDGHIIWPTEDDRLENARPVSIPQTPQEDRNG